MTIGIIIAYFIGGIFGLAVTHVYLPLFLSRRDECRRARNVGVSALAELDNIKAAIQDFDAETNAPIGSVLELSAIDRAAQAITEGMLAGERNVIDAIVREYHEIQVLYRNWRAELV